MVHLRYAIASLLAVASLLQSCRAFFDPITIGYVSFGVGSAALGWLKRGYLAEITYCKFEECCMKPYLKNDVEGLRIQLQRNLFGQHIVEDALIDALRGHFINIERSRKPLVMCFDGTTGTGKNYVADFIISSLFEKGINSKYVHKYTADFWFKYPANMVTSKLIGEIKQSIRACPYSLFVFDETQQMPKGALDSLVALLDHHTSSPEYDYTKSIFIFLSNNAGAEIAKQLKRLLDSGSYRDKTKLVDFERTIELAVYNMVGALKSSNLIQSNVIDHFIPFLPLEERHAKQCIEKEFELFCPGRKTQAKIEEVAQMTITLDADGLFQNSGCKRISKKVEAMCYN
ncbi:torsin-like protein [Sabethes cyaneus]|uniref:torsin-like protein n=1 Tax=Sabethes cyaneus TaxID=53552 RepID=UPI00237D8A05|nr:torsin-like protein [Sabethes cyaneus]